LAGHFLLPSSSPLYFFFFFLSLFFSFLFSSLCSLLSSSFFFLFFLLLYSISAPSSFLTTPKQPSHNSPIRILLCRTTPFHHFITTILIKAINYPNPPLSFPSLSTINNQHFNSINHNQFPSTESSFLCQAQPQNH
jgi:hypothetical protein